MNRGGREIRSVVRLICHTCARSRGAALFRPSRGAASELHETRFAAPLSAPALSVREEITASSFAADDLPIKPRETEREARQIGDRSFKFARSLNASRKISRPAGGGGGATSVLFSLIDINITKIPKSGDFRILMYITIEIINDYTRERERLDRVLESDFRFSISLR